jgi:hypothetical protein
MRTALPSKPLAFSGAVFLSQSHRWDHARVFEPRAWHGACRDAKCVHPLKLICGNGPSPHMFQACQRRGHRRMAHERHMHEDRLAGRDFKHVQVGA